MNKHRLNVGHYCLYEGKVVQIVSNIRNDKAEVVVVGYSEEFIECRFDDLERLPMKKIFLELCDLYKDEWLVYRSKSFRYFDDFQSRFCGMYLKMNRVKPVVK